MDGKPWARKGVFCDMRRTREQVKFPLFFVEKVS
jgi:hypothetical protein